jgi:hypothetical protein
MAHTTLLLHQLLSLQQAKDLKSDSLSPFLESLFNRHSMSYVDLTKAELPSNLSDQECLGLYLDDYSVLIAVKLKSAVSLGQVSGLMLSSLDTDTLNAKLLPFRRALSEARRRHTYSSIAFHKHAEVEVNYKRVELSGALPEGIKLMSALTTFVKLARVVRVNLTAVKHKLVKPVSHDAYCEMLKEYSAYVVTSTGLTQDRVSEELRVLKALHKDFNEGLKGVETARVRRSLRDQEDSLETSRAVQYEGRRSFNKNSRSRVGAEGVSPRPIEFIMETHRDASIDDNHAKVSSLPTRGPSGAVDKYRMRTSRALEELEDVRSRASVAAYFKAGNDDQGGMEQSESLIIFEEEDVSEGVVHRKVLSIPNYDAEVPSDKGIKAELSEPRGSAVVEHRALMECCSWDVGCSKLCMLI